MRLFSVAVSLLPLAVKGMDVVQSNDDGWEEKDIREMHMYLTTHGSPSFISAPAHDESGMGSEHRDPVKVGTNGCEFKSCPPDSPSIDRNESAPRFNYVNSFPVTAMRYGIEKLASEFFDGPPDLAITGPNIGANRGDNVALSGTVCAAVEAVNAGIPAIAFSGGTGNRPAWDAEGGSYVSVYAALALNVTKTLTGTGKKPYLPLNVNFPALSSDCQRKSDFKFAMSRMLPVHPPHVGDDIKHCGGMRRLPLERAVADTPGCFASISVGNMSKNDVDKKSQATVHQKLKPILSCL